MAELVTAAAISAKLGGIVISETIAFSPMDIVLYALSVGAEDVIRKDAKDLKFVWEEMPASQGTGFAILPTFFTTPSFRTTWRKSTFKLPRAPTGTPVLVHLSHRLVIHRKLPSPTMSAKRPNDGGAHPFPALNSFKTVATLADVVERDGDKGLLTVTKSDTFEARSDGTEIGGPLCTNYTTGLIGAPGLGGIGRRLPPAAGAADPLSRLADPDLEGYVLLGIPAGEAPTTTVWFKTHRMQAALHRMVAHDDNPIHISPEGAIAAGFPGPILHGLATFGIVGKIVTDACADGDGARLRSLNVRFTGPVIPGDELEVRIWDPLGAAGGAKGAGGVSSYKPGAKQFRRTIPKTGESVRIVVFEAAIVGKGKESVVVRDGQAEFWEKDAAGSKL